MHTDADGVVAHLAIANDLVGRAGARSATCSRSWIADDEIPAQNLDRRLLALASRTGARRPRRGAAERRQA
jgi:hypothetical protein